MDNVTPEEQTTLERIGRKRGPRGRLFGRKAEKVFRERNAHDFNYGGRTHEPDPDVNPEPVAPEPAASADMPADARSQPSPIFSSPLPDHAFQTGDLNEDPLEDEGAPVRAMRPANPVRRRGLGGMVKDLFTRH